MALIKCKDCGQMVSDTCEKCPNCGADIQQQIFDSLSPEEQEEILKQQRRLPTYGVLFAIGIFVVLFLYGLFTGWVGGIILGLVMTIILVLAFRAWKRGYFG